MDTHTPARTRSPPTPVVLLVSLRAVAVAVSDGSRTVPDTEQQLPASAPSHAGAMPCTASFGGHRSVSAGASSGASAEDVVLCISDPPVQRSTTQGQAESFTSVGQAERALTRKTNRPAPWLETTGGAHESDSDSEAAADSAGASADAEVDLDHAIGESPSTAAAYAGYASGGSLMPRALQRQKTETGLSFGSTGSGHSTLQRQKTETGLSFPCLLVYALRTCLGT